MATPVMMPKVGISVENCILTEWHKKKGDAVKVGDVLSVRENFRGTDRCKALLEEMKTKTAPKWVEVDAENGTVKVVAIPTKEDIDYEVNEQAIVEFYSK